MKGPTLDELRRFAATVPPEKRTYHCNNCNRTSEGTSETNEVAGQEYRICKHCGYSAVVVNIEALFRPFYEQRKEAHGKETQDRIPEHGSHGGG
jgi:peptide subunit release factor 1 (eRF1)